MGPMGPQADESDSERELRKARKAQAQDSANFQTLDKERIPIKNLSAPGASYGLKKVGRWMVPVQPHLVHESDMVVALEEFRCKKIWVAKLDPYERQPSPLYVVFDGVTVLRSSIAQVGEKYDVWRCGRWLIPLCKYAWLNEECVEGGIIGFRCIWLC
ncbi:hypothetical protein BC829DRAFT_26155 [Chytridium lagenaria]|nr:hypothetical protein BC829DRAFT_26155 [Chytridium lagenaria]